MLNMSREYTLRRTWLGIRLTEEKIRKILTDEKLSAIKAVLEKDHAIDCIFLLKMEKGRWKNAKAFMRDLGLTLSDGTFRSRMIEMEQLGLAESVAIDPLKKYYVITELGDEIAGLLLGFFGELE
jgi:DNA-binding HxlR family transcriptional regulator